MVGQGWDQWVALESEAIGGGGDEETLQEKSRGERGEVGSFPFVVLESGKEVKL